MNKRFITKWATNQKLLVGLGLLFLETVAFPFSYTLNPRSTEQFVATVKL